MKEGGPRRVYGPVSSRRLRRSLGIDLVPFKTCTYDCVYCQLGPTTNKTIERMEYVKVMDILPELERRFASGPPPDYITLAGSGEPTLNSNIGELIGRIKGLTHTPVAVLTNGSLLWMREVQDALMEVDLVLPSLDAGDERLFRRVNRPHKEITFASLVAGLTEFGERFPGPVWLEVFLLAGITGIPSQVEKVAALARRIRPARVQLNTVCRPPAEEFALRVPNDEMVRLKDRFPGMVEVISENEEAGPARPRVDDATDADILSLLSRRPCTVQGVSKGLDLRPGEAAKRLHALESQWAVATVRKDGAVFYKIVRT